MKILTPQQIAEASLEAGRKKASLTSATTRLIVQAVVAGCYIALGGTLSLLIGQGYG